MSRNLALEKVGRARVAYMLQQRGWKVGEAFDDGYDLLAYHPKSKKVSLIELKAMDTENRAAGVNLTAPLTETERTAPAPTLSSMWNRRAGCSSPRKQNVLTPKGDGYSPPWMTRATCDSPRRGR